MLESEKWYQGIRGPAGCGVLVDGAPLPVRLDLCYHSPSGFEWGYEGSGPSQLALAILADFLDDDERALRLYRRFRSQVVARFPHDGWDVWGGDLACWIRWAEHQEVSGTMSEGL